MDRNWINIEGDFISLDNTPQLLKDLNLMPLFIRRYFESKFTKDIEPSREEQQFFKRNLWQEKITDKDSLQKLINSDKLVNLN